MKTFNDINIEELQVGDKVEFLYKSSAPGNGTGSAGIETVKVKIKPKVFSETLEKIKDNYPKKTEEQSKTISELTDTWKILKNCKDEIESLKKESAELKGLKDIQSKNRRKEITERRRIIKSEQELAKDIISAYKEENVKSDQQNDNAIFFKDFSKKELNPEECYVQTVWYGGKSLDIRNGNINTVWISDTGYVKKDNFNKETMETT